MTSERYLVTGGMGCIGAWTLAHLVWQGKQAISFDLSPDRQRLDALLTADERAAITFVQGDLTDLKQIVQAIDDYQISRLIHLAALQIPFCRADPVMGARVNVVGTINIFEAARRAGLGHLTYASSIGVYGRAEEYPAGLVTHQAPRHPHTLYGGYKVANEDNARVYWQDYGLSTIALRPYTVYGVGRDQGLTSDPTKAMRAAVFGEPFEIGFSGPMQFQLASDVARQFIDAADHIDFADAAAFNLGTPVATVSELVDHIRAIEPEANITLKEIILPFPPGFDDSALRAAVPVVYETPLADGIAQTMAHFRRLSESGLSGYH